MLGSIKMSYIVIYSLFSFIILFLSTKIAYFFDLVDKPNKRKIHSKPTAFTGGIIISLILLISIKFFNYSNE